MALIKFSNMPLADKNSLTAKLEINKIGYGANIQNFIKKAIDYRNSEFAATAPLIVILGDSITSDLYAYTWSNYLKNILINNYGIPAENIEIHWYGGYGIENMVPFIDDILLFPNPDLIVFAENEGAGTGDVSLKRIEQTMQLIRERTTADLCITTWGSSDLTTIYNSGTPYTWSQVADMEQYKVMNFYRGLAYKYNAELLDFNQALIQWVIDGGNPASVYTDAPHMTEAGYNIVNAVVLKHFQDSTFIERLNKPNVLSKLEKSIHLVRDFVWESHLGSCKEVSFLNRANWLGESYNQYIYCSTLNEEMIIDFDGIGFELFYTYNGATHSIEISDDGGNAYVAPSAYDYYGKPLQYATEVRSITYAANADLWRTTRPIMHVEVLNNILPDGTLISGQYKIKVKTVTDGGESPDTVVCELFNPAGTSLGTFTVGTTETIGDFRLPAGYNGRGNSFNSVTYSNWKVDDEYEFYVKSNWRDTFSTGTSVKIIGLKNQNHKIKIKKLNTSVSYFKLLKLFKPIEF